MAGKIFSKQTIRKKTLKSYLLKTKKNRALMKKKKKKKKLPDIYQTPKDLSFYSKSNITT